MTGPLSIRKLGRGATPRCCCCFFLGGGRGKVGERARFERFLSIVISYFDQNDLGGGGGRESSI